jgi:hypothetical protein
VGAGLVLVGADAPTIDSDRPTVANTCNRWPPPPVPGEDLHAQTHDRPNTRMGSRRRSASPTAARA